MLTGRQMSIVVGCGLISIPFIALYIYVGLDIGFWVITKIYLGVSVALGCIFGGIVIASS
jgi:hypothetical protein